MKKLFVFSVSLVLLIVTPVLATWESVTPSISPTPKGQNELYILGPGDVRTAGNDGNIATTADGGANWSQGNPTVKDLFGIDYYDGIFYYAGEDDAVLSSEASGSLSTATYLAPTGVWTPGEMTVIKFFDHANGWVMGKRDAAGPTRRNVFKTTDGGGSWSDFEVTGRDIVAADFRSTSLAYAMAQSGFGLGAYILTFDLSAADPSSPTENDFGGLAPNLIGTGIHMLTDQRGYAVAYYQLNGDGAVFKTTDGWATNPTEVNPDIGCVPHDVFFINENLGWVVGTSTAGYGLIMQTTDGGVNWSISVTDTTATNAKLYDLDFLVSESGNARTVEGWAVGRWGGNGGFARTYKYTGAPEVSSFEVYYYQGATAETSNILPRNVEVILNGSGFVNGATVEARMTGQTPITASPVTFESASKLICTFDFSNAVSGTWDLVVTNPDTSANFKAASVATPGMNFDEVRFDDTYYTKSGSDEYGSGRPALISSTPVVILVVTSEAGISRTNLNPRCLVNGVNYASGTFNFSPSGVTTEAVITYNITREVSGSATLGLELTDELGTVTTKSAYVSVPAMNVVTGYVQPAFERVLLPPAPGQTTFRGTLDIVDTSINPQQTEIFIYDSQGRALLRRLLSNVMVSPNTGTSVSGKINVVLPIETDRPDCVTLPVGIHRMLMKEGNRRVMVRRGTIYVVPRSWMK